MAAAVAAFGLGTPVRPPEPVARGAMGEIYRVDVAHGSFALKRLFDWNQGTGAEAEAAFTERARAAGVPTPVELRALTGELVAHVGEAKYRAYSWLDLHDPLRPPVATETLVELGHVIGRLHAIAPETTTPVEDWYVKPPDATQWQELSDNASAAKLEWADRLASALPLLIAEAEWTAQVAQLPVRICHRDLDPSNVFMQRVGGLAVLDLENLGPLAPEHDLGMALLSFVAVNADDVRQQVRHVRTGYVAAGGSVDTLTEDSFAVVLIARLNFVHLQAQAALAADTTDEHRRFADTVVAAVLRRPSSRRLLAGLVEGWTD